MTVRRNYAAIEASLLDHEKWSVLTWAERGQWLAVRLLAERQIDSGTFPSKTTLAILLRKEGVPKPEDVIAKLVEVRFLDVDEDGRVHIHDRDQWRPETSTERVQAWRKRKKLSPDQVDNDAETGITPDETFHSVSEQSGNSPEHEGTARGEESRGENRRVLEPLTPLKRGTRGSRANGTNPRAIAALAREARKRQKRDLHFSYLRGEMTEAEFTERTRLIDVDRPSSQAS